MDPSANNLIAISEDNFAFSVLQVVYELALVSVAVLVSEGPDAMSQPFLPLTLIARSVSKFEATPAVSKALLVSLTFV